MLMKAVKNYLSSNVTLPYFLITGDSQYQSDKAELSASGFTFINVSDYCSSEDKLPDIDGLFDRLKTASVNSNDNKLVVIGLGEYLALRGNNEAVNILSRLKDLNTGIVKVALLLRGVTTQVKELEKDPRFDSRRLSILGKANCDLSFTLTVPNLCLPAMTGIKNLLKALEEGTCGNVVINTTLSFDNALFTVHKIENAYNGIKFISSGFHLPRTCGNDEQWAELLMELAQHNNSLATVFEKYGFSDFLETDFFTRIVGLEYRNWVYFIALKSKSDALSNSYLRFVLDNTNCFNDFKVNVLNAIIEISHTDKRFEVFYAERKMLVEKFSESDIANFVINNRKNLAESIYKLTDTTRTECQEIIAWISQNKVVPQIVTIYPALDAYLEKYVFNCGDLSDLLTEYFDAYKRQKVSNTLEASFIEKVEAFAKNREYNRLPTRNEIIDSLNKDDSYLYWLDALGVEYLSFIMELAHKRGLSILISIARAELPTRTSFNRDFYDNWQGHRKEKNNKLDDAKHKDAGGYNFGNNALPIHLAEELDIISEVIEKAATELELHHCECFVIASDHGASRLAVLRKKEELYETDTKGEHSGRCCKFSEAEDLPFATVENGYLVLADYGRFKGSRAANVEVHGGASLEEVVVPIIELRLKNNSITVQLVEKFVAVDFRTGIEITLFFNAPVKDVSLVLNSKRYAGVKVDDNHYKVALSDIKRGGDYPADVFAGDDLINKIQIKAQGKSGKVNDAFDDLF